MSEKSGNLIAYLHFLTNCGDMDALWDEHVKCMASYGFDRLIYGYTRYISRESLGDPADFVLLSNHDVEYTDVFIGKKQYLYSPSSKIRFWS